MEDLNAVNKRVHKIMMTNRRTCTINGVCDVLSFDIHEILLETDQGMLMIKGDELHVNRLMLDKGEVDVDGKMDSLTYSETSGQSGKTNPCLPDYSGKENVWKALLHRKICFCFIPLSWAFTSPFYMTCFVSAGE